VSPLPFFSLFFFQFREQFSFEFFFFFDSELEWVESLDFLVVPPPPRASHPMRKYTPLLLPSLVEFPPTLFLFIHPRVPDAVQLYISPPGFSPFGVSVRFQSRPHPHLVLARFSLVGFLFLSSFLRPEKLAGLFPSLHPNPLPHSLPFFTLRIHPSFRRNRPPKPIISTDFTIPTGSQYFFVPLARFSPNYPPVFSFT